MDEIDVEILNCLRENARAKLSTIAERVCLSVTATADRIRKLEKSGIITGYGITIDERKVGRDISALISVSIEHPRYNDDFINQVNAHPDILECLYVTGDYDFSLKVVTSGSEGLEKVLNFVKGIKGVSLTRTLVILKTVKSEISVHPTADK